MPYQIKGKVALITGGASGIGLKYAKELLRNELRGVTIADVNKEYGKKALEEIKGEFGPNKAIFFELDVTNYKKFEEAFKKTVEHFKNIDILINNAGVLNDKIWEKQIAININGTVYGILLGLEHYLQKYRSDSEAVIVNISSIAAVDEFTVIPVYCGTKAAVAAMTLNWGHKDHYDRTKVKVVAIGPGVTDTPLISEISGRNMGPQYEVLLKKFDNYITQPPDAVAIGIVKVIKNAPSGTFWIVEENKDPYQYIYPERKIYAPK